MVAVALLLPPFLLCVVLALGRYEERLLSSPAPEHPVQPQRPLRPVPGLPCPEPPPPVDRASPAGPLAEDRGRQAA
ncbi:hypothetical protein FGW37_32385 [Streptomyces rectiverticillatus]|uniref:hypothetical protein n=1 Tax=Streptomyces rectiverticillatus TaxID=173860 RepID=UPI0015C387D9|nr:hypothetical protein [Streptomyces rectiverticillatus]QLE75667.1 hypothetical protein FGW37_32385 [Streptomyces rectiverticillatus]